jgi:hypothetical protein
MGTPVPDEDFTPESLHTLLREKVLKGSAVLPLQSDPGIKLLVRYLNNLREFAKNWRVPWPEKTEQLNKVGEAVGTLAELLPGLRDDYAKLQKLLECLYTRSEVAEAQADLDGFDLLIFAVTHARQRKLPFGRMGWHFGKKIECWEDVAKDLQKAFHDFLPGQSKEAGLRFIVEVVPAIVQQHPTFHAVRTALMRNRLVNRGERGG